MNRAPWSPGRLSRAYASSLSRYSGAGPGSLRPRPFPRSTIGFPKEVLRVQASVVLQYLFYNDVFFQILMIS